MTLSKCFTAAFVALLSAGTWAETASAQTILAADSALAFIGDWSVAVEADPPVTMKINITNNNGQVAAFVTGLEGTVTKVEDISKDANGLVMKYVASIQGQSIPIKITLTPEPHTGNLLASIDLAEGLATFPGSVTSAERQ